MNILLIDPSWRYGKLHGPSLGLSYLASVARSLGSNVTILDFVRAGSENVSTVSEFKRHEDEFFTIVEHQSASCDLIGITCNYATFPRALKTAQKCRASNPQAMIILGGPQISALNYLSLARRKEYLPVNKDVDLYVVSEGDQTFAEIIERLQSGKPIAGILGTVMQVQGGFVRNPQRALIKDLNSINLPAWDLFNLSHYPNLLPITASRGCPYRCTFCDERLIWKNRYRYRTPLNIVSELMTNVQQFGVTRFRFADSTLTSYPALKEMCNLVVNKRLDIKWSCYARANELNDKNLASLKKAGCVSVLIGVESGTQEVLNAMNKKVLLQNIVDAVKLCKTYGIKVEASFIIGFPGETEEDVYKTIDFAKRLEADSYDWHSFSPGLEMLAQLNMPEQEVEKLIRWSFEIDLDMPSRLYPEVFRNSDLTLFERHASARIPVINTRDHQYSLLPNTLSMARIHSLVQLAIDEIAKAGLSSEESLEYRVLLY
ncbi:MAG: radical SAM protein [Bacillota bacterium]|nr:radical SAM protein [Bacillota bacterium]